MIDYLELFTLTIESLSKKEYPSQLASELDDEIARLELLRFMTGDSSERLENSASIPSEPGNMVTIFINCTN